MPDFKKSIKSAWPILLWLAWCVLAFFTLVSFWDFENYRFDIITQFRVQYFVVCLMWLLMVGLFRRRVLFVLTFVLVAINGGQIFYWPTTKEAVPDAERYSLMSLNLYMGNRQHDDILRYIKAEDPDVLFLIETVHLWRDVVEPLRKHYPYHVIRYGRIENGVAFYSKYPLKALRRSVTQAVVEVQLPQGEVLLVGCHPPAPRNQKYLMSRNQYMERLTRFAGQEEGPLIVLGDFNNTPWNPQFKRFMNTSGLQLVKESLFWQRTWPVDNQLIGVPIDHFLFKGTLRPISFSNGEAVGSDHYSIKMEFQLDAYSQDQTILVK